VRYDHKCTWGFMYSITSCTVSLHVQYHFMYSITYSCQILETLENFRQIFEEYTQLSVSWKPIQGTRRCSMRTDG